MADIPVIHLTGSKGYSTIGDCCICCIATLADKEYEDVVAAAVPLVGETWKQGMYQKDIIRVAAAVGLKLRRRRKYETDTDCGILNVDIQTTVDAETIAPAPQEHVVVLMGGFIFDNDYRVWDVDAYIMHYQAELGQLLEVM